MSVNRLVPITVIHHNHIAIAAVIPAGINHHAIGDGGYCVAQAAGNIDAEMVGGRAVVIP